MGAESWKSAALVRTFLDGVRGGIPMAAEQIDAMLRVIDAHGGAVHHILDLGCGSGVLARALLARHPQAGCTLVDFSEPMLEAARAQLGTHEPRPQFVLADLGAPGWRRSLAGAITF